MTSDLLIHRGDVVRARRLGNKTRDNYVIDRLAREGTVYDVGAGYLTVYAHREYGGSLPQFMLLDLTGARVLRSHAS